MAISKAKDPSVMMFPSDFLLLLALLREVVDRAHSGHGGGRPHRGPETQILFKNSKYGCSVIFLSMKPLKKQTVLPFIDL